ncbi:MAG: tetratricopeptide repeat protein [Candidatus Muiribacteriota bacterium]
MKIKIIIIFIIFIAVFSSASEDGLFEKGLNYLNNNELKKAETVFTRLYMEDETDYRVLNNLGVVFFEQKQYNKAYNLFDKARKIQPDYKNAYINMGYVYFERDAWLDMLELAQEGKKYFKDELDSILLLESYAWYRMRRFEQSKQIFDKINKKNIKKEIYKLYEHLEKKLRLLP